MEIKVNIKHMGKKRNTIEPTVYHLETVPQTLRELILEVVKAGVREYEKQMDAGNAEELLRCLTREEIEEQAAVGKVSFGRLYGEGRADYEEAAANAIQCFEDGIYRIFLDERPLERLDENIHTGTDGKNDGVFTFVRLTMLSGRMW